MALRIHFPWQLLLTVLGFAALGAGVGYLLAHDFHGQLYRQLALHAAGAGFVGACAWFLSERVSHAVNLNTSPFFRLALSAAAATGIAALMVGPYIEFATASTAPWAEPAAILFYVAAGVMPMVAVVSLLAFGEALLAARRGDADLKSALRPILSAAVVGALVGGVAAYGAIEVRSQIREGMLALLPERPRASGWLERQELLFTQVLSGGQCAVLVVPFETVEAAGARSLSSLDRPARSLISRQVAAGVAARTGQCVADPTLVSRALGPRQRNYEWSRILRLANAAGARWIVRGMVKLDSARQAYDLTVQMFAREPGDKPRWTPGEAVEWGPLVFSDELPPEAAFQPIAARVVERLGLPEEAPVNDASSSARAAQAPATFDRLADDPGSALGRAQRLQLVAIAYPPSEVNGEQLWERSLIAVQQLPAEDEQARIVRARAALHLYRRPYAVALLRGLEGPEAQTLLAQAEGNLPNAEAVAQRITDPTAALITQVELELMRTRYARSAGFQERRRDLIDKHPGYAALLYAALSGDESLRPAGHEVVWRQLENFGVPLAEPIPSAVLRAIPPQIGEHLWISRDIVRLPAAIESSYAPLWRSQAAPWRIARAFDRLAPWDLCDAMYGVNRAVVVASAKSISSQQLRPEAVLAFSNALGQTFAGYPPLEEATAWALGQLRYERKGAPDRLLDDRQRLLLRDLLAWGGGETEAERFLSWALTGETPDPYLDEPPREWRALSRSAREPSRADLERDVAQELRALNFSQYDFSHLANAQRLLERLGQKGAAEQVALQAQTRFAGNPARDEFLLKLAESRRDTAGYASLIEQKIREQPEQWALYYRLAQAHLLARKPEQAQHTLLSFPLWRSEKGDAAALSSQALDGGLLLLRVGEAELARPLFQLGARYQSGSGAELWNGLWLARLDHNWPEIRSWGHRLHQQQKDAWGLSDAAYASFLIGDLDEGWRTFYEASRQFEDARPWAAAVAGHRIAATTDDELIGFARRWKSLSGNAEADALLRQSFVFSALMLDRTPSERTFGSIVSTAAGDSAYASLARGYRAFKRGEYAAAAEQLAKFSDAGKAQSATAQQQNAFALPYLSASLVKAGRGAEAQALLAEFNKRAGHDFYYLLASAYMQGLGGDARGALDSLWQAQIGWPDSATAAVPPSFQLLETCEKLYELTGDVRYKNALLDLARRQRVLWPWSWAYTFEAKYAGDAQEREAALGIALFLDAQSDHLAGFNAAQRKRAQRWFAANNPFKKP